MFAWRIGNTGEIIHTDTMSAFREVAANLASVWQSSAKWGDYDRDGDLDVVVSGLNGIGQSPEIGAVTRLYDSRNLLFFENRTTNLPGVYAGESAWGDIDGDGDLDLVLTGATRTREPYTPLTALFRNDGGGFTELPSNLPHLAFGAVAWADVDGDGDLDLALQGERGNGELHSDVYINEGNGRFEPMGAPIPPLAFGSFDWADFGNDGDPDLLVTGGRYGPNLLEGVTYIYINEGGRLVQLETEMVGTVFGSAGWTDFDMDGLLDVVLVGPENIVAQPVFLLYLNTGTSMKKTFLHSGAVLSDLAVGDFNDDGDPDAALIGKTLDELVFLTFVHNEINHDPHITDIDPRIATPFIQERIGCFAR